MIFSRSDLFKDAQKCAKRNNTAASIFILREHGGSDKNCIFLWINDTFLLKVRSLRLRLQKTKRIGEADYNITSVQDDHTEIMLSSGNIRVDLLLAQKAVSHKGTFYRCV